MKEIILEYKGNNEKFDLDDDNDDELEIQAFLKLTMNFMKSLEI